MMKFKFLFVVLFLMHIQISTLFSQVSNRPNIIYILADDLGYGDLTAYNKESKIPTPNLDKLAAQGMRFTDAHSTSGVCTPTRYSILTGRYPWRSRLPVGVLRGYSRPLIEDDRPTVASLLKSAGYNTAVIGKWHLGLGWVPKREYEHLLENKRYGIDDEMNPNHIDLEKEFTYTPNTLGFDYSFVLPASLDMPPYCYVENRNLIHPLNSFTKGSKPDTGYAGAFWREGLMSSNFDFYDVIPNFIRKANGFIQQQSAEKPFFLYLPLPAPHTPWVPSSTFRSKSKVGEYGDFVMQLDASVGLLMNSLDSMGLSKNTMIIFTSDNGPYWRNDYINKYDHRSAGYWRGMKGDAFEGGHRIPFIVRWPAAVKAGRVSDATTTLANLMSTCVDILGIQQQQFVTEDSYSILPVLTGRSKNVPMQPAVVHSSSIGFFAIRDGDWKLIEGLGSGGFTVPKQIKPTTGEVAVQLYNLKNDPSERANLADQYPEKVFQLKSELSRIKGANQKVLRQ